MGFTTYLIDAQVPTRLADWVRQNIESKWVFLLGLNAFLIVVGGIMDIFSAIIVVVLFVQLFFFQDNNFRATETRIAPYVPDASVLVRATLSF